MKTFGTYFLLEYKKSIKVLPKTFGSTLLALGLMLAGVWLVSYFAFQSHVFAKINVAIVVPEEQSEVQTILQLAQTMESVESVCNFVYQEEAEAMEQLVQGQVSAAIILPEHFYEDIDSGYNTPLTVYVSEDAALNQLVFQELLTDGVSLLRTAESGVYSMLHTARIYPAKINGKEIGDYIAGVYLNEAFRRNEIFEESVYSSFGEVNLYQYYFVAVLNMILLMFGMNFGFLYRERSRTVEEQLKTAGIGAGRIALVKIAVMSALLWAVGLIVYAVGLILSKGFKWNILFWDGGAPLALLLLSVSVAAYLHMLYAFAGRSGRGAFLVFAVNGGMILCSGAVIPAVYLPKAAAFAGKFLPLCLWDQYAAETFLINGSAGTVLCLLVMTAMMMGIGVAASWKNT